jgi:hypothetical protein
MFHGQPFCKACGYQGPDFMWMYHQRMGMGVLIQNRDSLALRVCWVDDQPAHSPNKTEDEAGAAWENHARETASRDLAATERIVPVTEFARFDQGDSPGTTDLPCPECRAMLRWRHTGIS